MHRTPFTRRNASRKVGTEETGVGRLIRHARATDRGQPKVDGGRCIPALLEMNAVAEHHRAVERQARFQAVPRDELANGVVIGALPAGGR